MPPLRSLPGKRAAAGPFAGRFGREEWLKELISDLGWNSDAVVSNCDLNRISEISCRYPQGRFEIGVASFLLAFGGRVESVAEHVETDARDVLGH